MDPPNKEMRLEHIHLMSDQIKNYPTAGKLRTSLTKGIEIMITIVEKGPTHEELIALLEDFKGVITKNRVSDKTNKEAKTHEPCHNFVKAFYYFVLDILECSKEKNEEVGRLEEELYMAERMEMMDQRLEGNAVNGRTDDGIEDHQIPSGEDDYDDIKPETMTFSPSEFKFEELDDYPDSDRVVPPVAKKIKDEPEGDQPRAACMPRTAKGEFPKDDDVIPRKEPDMTPYLHLFDDDEIVPVTPQPLEPPPAAAGAAMVKEEEASTSWVTEVRGASTASDESPTNGSAVETRTRRTANVRRNYDEQDDTVHPELMNAVASAKKMLQHRKSCQYCGAPYFRRHTLEAHEEGCRARRIPPERRNCKKCGKLLFTDAAAQAHESECKGSAPAPAPAALISCPNCSSPFLSPEALKRHVLACTKTIERKKELASFVPESSRQFRRRRPAAAAADYKLQLQLQQQQPAAEAAAAAPGGFPCEHCGSRFWRADALERHAAVCAFVKSERMDRSLLQQMQQNRKRFRERPIRGPRPKASATAAETEEEEEEQEKGEEIGASTSTDNTTADD